MTRLFFILTILGRWRDYLIPWRDLRDDAFLIFLKIFFFWFLGSETFYLNIWSVFRLSFNFDDPEVVTRRPFYPLLCSNCDENFRILTFGIIFDHWPKKNFRIRLNEHVSYYSACISTVKLFAFFLHWMLFWPTSSTKTARIRVYEHVSWHSVSIWY